MIKRKDQEKTLKNKKEKLYGCLKPVRLRVQGKQYERIKIVFNFSMERSTTARLRRARGGKVGVGGRRREGDRKRRGHINDKGEGE